MQATLPPGPRMPAALQTIGWWTRPLAFTERQRARYGSRFTLRLLGQPPIVVLTDPAELKQFFTAAPDVLHPGEGARLLEPIVGPNSVILLDEAPHLEQRKLMLPAFHGDRMQRLTGLMTELTERELDSWPVGQAVELHEPLPATHARDHPARGLRSRRGLAPRPAARAPAGAAGVRRQPDLAAAPGAGPARQLRALRRSSSARRRRSTASCSR